VFLKMDGQRLEHNIEHGKARNSISMCLYISRKRPACAVYSEEHFTDF
jgi:hypothetical protein